MQIFNTLTRQKEEFVPQVPGEYRIYVCGPTVYNYIHIGNARPLIVFDTLRRYLEYRGNKVIYVSNITDIDDKLIKKGHVIEAVTSDYLYIEFPDRDEGFMTKLRSKIVSRQSLNAIARQIGLDRYVILDGSSNTLAQKHIFGDAFEAMMGAIYLDQGYNFVNRLLINRLFREHLSLEELTESENDFKTFTFTQ